MEEEIERIREASGYIQINSKLVSFLYQLMRDEVTPGIISKIMIDSVKEDDVIYSNGWLAKYAEYIAERLLEK